MKLIDNVMYGIQYDTLQYLEFLEPEYLILKTYIFT